MIYSPICT